MRELLTFDDVTVVPKFSFTESRGDVVLRSNIIRGVNVSLPVISANMDTITDFEMAKAMLKYGAQACLHRFGTIGENVDSFKKSINNNLSPLVSVGLGSGELERAEALFNAGAHTFVIDVAHGAQIAVVRQAKKLREIVGPYPNIIVGNFATGESVATFLDHSGAIVDGFKVGIGPGSACTTRVKTGVGVPQLSAIIDVVQTLKISGIPVIADGGLKTPGCIAKALVAGATAVMVGGMLSGTEETPGITYYINGSGDPVKREDFLVRKIDDNGKIEYISDDYSESFKKVKKYRGSASQESYEVQGKVAKHRTAEGESFFVKYKGPVEHVLQDIEGGLRSIMGYIDAGYINEMPSKGEFVRVTAAGYYEGTPHGNK